MSLKMPAVSLAIFDLDHTLLAADSSQSWAEEMQRLGWIEDQQFWPQHQAMMREYEQGDLDMLAYLRLNLSPLKGRSIDEVQHAANHLVHQQLIQQIYPAAYALLDWHRQQGHILLLISASEDFLVQPLADHLGFDAVLAIQLLSEHQRYTGQVALPLSYQQGKIERLQSWLAEQKLTVQRSWFYSDSHNDLPLLEWVDEPRPVNANARLSQAAAARGWIVQTLAPLHPSCPSHSPAAHFNSADLSPLARSC